MNDSNKGNVAVTSGPGSKSSCERLEKSIETECELLSKAIQDSMGNFTLFFVQPDGGIGNKVIRLGFESILNVGNNGFILSGTGKVSGKKVCRGKFVDDFRKIKIFYNANTKTYSWVKTYKVNSQKNIRATKECDLIFPKGDSHELLENKINEEHLFAIIDDYIQVPQVQNKSKLFYKREHKNFRISRLFSNFEVLTNKINYFYNLQDTVFYTKEAGATTRWVESVPPKLFRFVNV